MSKYTFYNKIMTDEELYKNLARKLIEPITPEIFNEASIKELSELLENKFKISIGFKFVDYDDIEVIKKYGIKNTTFALAHRYPDSKFYVWFNKHTEHRMNRLYFLTVVGMIVFDDFKLEEDRHLTSTSILTNDQLAYSLAKELTMPSWKLKNYLEKEYSEELILKWNPQVSKEILEILKK